MHGRAALNRRRLGGLVAAAAAAPWARILHAAAGAPLRIGVVGPFTGNAAPVGAAIRNGVDLAMADAAGAGRLPVQLGGTDHQIEIHEIDTGDGREVTAARLTAAISEHGVRLFVGGWYGASAMKMMEVEAGRGVIHIGHLAETPLIAYQILGDPERYRGWFKSWPSAPNLANQYVAPLRRFVDDGQWQPATRRAAIVVERTLFGDSWGEAFSRSFSDAGFTVRPYDSVRLAESDYEALLTNYSDDGISLVAMVTSRRSSAMAFLDQYRARRLPAVVVGHGFSWFADLAENRPGRDAFVVSMDRPHALTAAQHAWVRRYEERFQVPPDLLFAGHSYDYFSMLLAALAAAGAQDFEPLTAKLRTLTHQGVWQAYDFAEHAGPRALAPNEIMTGPFMEGFFLPMAQRIDGRARVVWPPDHAEADFQPPPWA